MEDITENSLVSFFRYVYDMEYHVICKSDWYSVRLMDPCAKFQRNWTKNVDGCMDGQIRSYFVSRHSEEV